MESTPVQELPSEPSNGDLILHCGHMLGQKKHCFYAPKGIIYHRPDKSKHTAKWFVCCEQCFKDGEGNPAKMKVKGDGVWEKK